MKKVLVFKKKCDNIDGVIKIDDWLIFVTNYNSRLFNYITKDNGVKTSLFNAAISEARINNNIEDIEDYKDDILFCFFVNLNEMKIKDTSDVFVYSYNLKKHNVDIKNGNILLSIVDKMLGDVLTYKLKRISEDIHKLVNDNFK